MDFELTDEQRLLKHSVREFMKKECPRDLIRDIDEKEEFPHDIYKKMAALGWAGIHIPERYGGQGMNFFDFILFMEELGYFFPMMTGTFIDAGLVCKYLEMYGTGEQKERFLPPVARGDVHYCFALTEPDAGSDASSLTTSATKKGNLYILNGTKVFITGAHLSDRILVFARTDDTLPKHQGISTFLVKTDSPGIELRKIPALGMKPYYPNEISFDNVKVPEDNLVGGLNNGWRNLGPVINSGRIVIAVCSVGVTQATIDIALDYAKKRQQFGQPIGKFQALQHRFALMQVRANAARGLANHAASMYDKGVKCFKEASIAKYYATENLVKTVNEGLQIMGGYGYTLEYDMQLFLRDTRFFTIGGGTSEIQLNIIAQEMGLGG